MPESALSTYVNRAIKTIAPSKSSATNTNETTTFDVFHYVKRFSYSCPKLNIALIIPRLCSLQSLYLSHAALSNEDVQLLIRQCHINAGYLIQDGIESPIRRYCSLEHIDLSFGHLTSAAIREFIQNVSTVTSVSVDEFPNDEILLLIANNWKTLKNLEIISSCITEASMLAFTKNGQQLNRLKIYESSWTTINDVSMSINGTSLIPMSSFTTIKELSLSYLNLSEENLIAILCPLISLEILHLCVNNKASDAVFMILGTNSLNLKSLSVIGFQYNFTDNGVIALANGCRNLESFRVTGCAKFTIVTYDILSRAYAHSLRSIWINESLYIDPIEYASRFKRLKDINDVAINVDDYDLL